MYQKLQSDDGHSGPGWYVYSDQYPDEGSMYCPTEQEANVLVEQMNNADQDEQRAVEGAENVQDHH